MNGHSSVMGESFQEGRLRDKGCDPFVAVVELGQFAGDRPFLPTPIAAPHVPTLSLGADLRAHFPLCGL